MKRFAWFAFALSVTACTDQPQEEEDLDGDGKADGGSPTVSNDNLNGYWDGTGFEDTVIESWTGIGIRIHVGDKVVELTRTGNKLKGDGIALDVKPNGPGAKDDTIEGKIDGATVKLAR